MLARSMPYHPVVHVAGGMLIFAAAMNGLFLLSWHKWPDWPLMVEAIVAYPVIFFLGSRSLHKLYQKEFEPKITLTEDHITSQTRGGSEGKYEWRAVQKIIQKPNAIVIQVSRKPDYYLWIPKRCFPTSHAAEEFYSRAKEYWENLRFAPLPELSFSTPITDDSHSADASISLMELMGCNYFLFKWVVVIGLLAVSAVLGEIIMFHSTYGLVSNGLLGLVCVGFPALVTWLRVKNHPEWLSARITITKDEIISEGKESGMFSRFRWSSVKKIRKWNNILLLTLDTRWTVCIPLRSFPTPVSADEFCALADGYRRQAQPSKKVAIK